MIVEMRLVDWLTAARLSNDTLILTLPTLPRSVDTALKARARAGERSPQSPAPEHTRTS